MKQLSEDTQNLVKMRELLDGAIRVLDVTIERKTQDEQIAAHKAAEATQSELGAAMSTLKI